MKKLKSVLLVLIMAAICLISYYMFIAVVNDGVVTDINEEESTSTPEVENKEEKVTISLVAVGDNFVHDSVIESGKQPDGVYNYDFLFENIRNDIEEADIAAIYQTMIIAGNDKGLSGYPSFNTPEEMIDAISNAGFDVALMASNHSNDKGTDGIEKCISLWKEKSSVQVLGINSNEQEAVNIPIIEVKGKRVALLNYTTNMNNPITDDSKQFMVNNLGILNTTTGAISSTNMSNTVINDIKRADEQADIVVVFPYWGNDYSHETSQTQKKWAEAMTEAGADIIIGARTHYVGEIEEVVAENGNKALCYYSLGTFCSSFNDVDAMVGGMAKITIVVEGDSIYIDKENTGMVPIITHYTHTGEDEDDMANITGVYPISRYTSEMALGHGIITRAQVKFDMEIIEKIITDNISEDYLMR